MPPEPPTIRPATPEDAPRLAVLSEALGYPVSPEVLDQRLARLLPNADHTILVAQLPSGGVVGWLHGATLELLEAGTRCEILGLVVDAGHRRLGVGRRLVQAVEAWARGRGLQEISVRSNVVRAEAHPFYEGLGFTRAKTQHAYRKQIPNSGTR